LAAIQACLPFVISGYFPRDRFTVVTAIALLAALNSVLFFGAAVKSIWPLQIGSLVCLAVGLLLVLVPSLGLTSIVRGVLATLSCLGLLTAGCICLPAFDLRVCLGAQQVAAVATLLGWLATEPIRLALQTGDLIQSSYFRTGMKSLYTAPLVLAGIVAVATLSEKKSRWVAVASIGVGQYGIGCFELGRALGAKWVMNAGLAIGCSMILVLILARSCERSESQLETA
jgi:hypothetical protein